MGGDQRKRVKRINTLSDITDIYSKVCIHSLSKRRVKKDTRYVSFFYTTFGGNCKGSCNIYIVLITRTFVAFHNHRSRKTALS